MKAVVLSVFWSMFTFRMFVAYVIWMAHYEVDTLWIRDLLIIGSTCYAVLTIRKIFVFYGVSD
jgi:hypothetical protein